MPTTIVGISLFQTEFLLIPVINNMNTAAGGTADGISLVVIHRGDTPISPGTPMSHQRNVRITLPTTVNIRSAVVSTDISDNVYLTAADEAFIFYKLDSSLALVL